MKHYLLLVASIVTVIGCSSDNGNSALLDSDTGANNVRSNGATTDVPDPMVQNNTDVIFEISVPAYQSEELQLRLDWGEFSTSLNWVGDDFWSVEARLPSNTKRLLSIVFFDENGGIELGSFEQQYETGINAAEVFQVTADQFDTDSWDFDNDGVNNLNELIAGTNPRLGEDSLLPIIDNQRMSLLFIANYYEIFLPNERPYLRDDEIDYETVLDGTENITADIDANGDGRLTVVLEPYRPDQNFRSGNRSVLENSIQWDGSWGFQDDFNLNQSFTSEVSANGDTRSLVEVGSGSWVGTYTHRWDTTVNVTGQLIEGSSFCEVASGTITETYTTNDQSRVSTTTLTITRASVDDFWRVSKVYESDDTVSIEDYFARELSMHMILFGYQKRVSANDYFFCDYVEL